jgi:hypothetical protein
MNLGGDMNRVFGSALLGLILVGCGDDGGDTGMGSKSGDTGMGSNSGEETGCVVMEETALALDGTTPSGYPVIDSVNILDGEHLAELTWSDDSSTALTVSISDVSNARFQDMEVYWGSGPSPTIDLECNDQLVFDIQLSIVTEDGQLNETLSSTATQIEGETSPTIVVDLSTATGTFNVMDWTDETFDTTSASLSADWNENGIQGTIDGIGESTDGDLAMATRIDVATFGATGF